jgi:uncharacterized membrane protein
MDVISTMCTLVLLFIGSHVGLTLRPVRSRLAAALGEWGFLAIYFAVAAASFTAATVYYADHRLEGPRPRAGWRRSAPAAPDLPAVAGVVRWSRAFQAIRGRPTASREAAPGAEPRGLERVTRHPFFAGMALFATAHALLATHLIGTVLMLGLGRVADRRPVASGPEARAPPRRGFAEYLRATSAVPFAAIAAGRQSPGVARLPFSVMAAGLAIAAGLRGVHGEIFAHRGAAVAAAPSVGRR